MNESALILADFIPETLESYQQIDLQLFDLAKLFKKSSASASPVNYLLLVENPKAVLKTIKSGIKLIGAAGGLVKNGDGKLLFIYRLGKWDLPKGKIDAGEKRKKAAVREVEEECGIQVDYLGPKIKTSYHVYEMKGEVVMKKTAWYEMAVNGSPKLIPQTSEDITEAKWIDPHKLAAILSNTYGIIKDVLSAKSYR